jgi:hypothetical protein
MGRPLAAQAQWKAIRVAYFIGFPQSHRMVIIRV